MASAARPQVVDQAQRAKDVGVAPVARDLGDARWGDARATPERLSRFWVREMDLDDGDRDGSDRVEDRDGRVRVRRGVEDDAVEAGVGRGADARDERPLAVGLIALDDRTALFGGNSSPTALAFPAAAKPQSKSMAVSL